MMIRRAVSIIVCCVALVGNTNGAQAVTPPEIFVAPSGNDMSPGTFDEPFATLTRARDEVRQLIAAELTQDVTVFLRGGVYRITEAIEFGIQDSSPDPFSVTYAAYPDEEPIISGGKPITGWSNQGNGTWTTTLPDVASGLWRFRELFVNGGRRQRARHPNDGFLTVAGPDPTAPPETRMSFAFVPGDIPIDTNLAGGELIFLHDWNTSRVLIDNVDHAQHVLTVAQPIGPSPALHVFSQLEHPRYAVENDPVLIDAPGEWYLDEQTGELTYLPMPGEDISTIDAVAPIADALLVVRGDDKTEQFVRNLRFRGIAFEHCAWDLPDGGYAEWQAGFYDWRDAPAPYELPNALTFELADSCRFEDGRIAHLGGWGISFGQSCKDCAFIGNVVTDIAGNGVMIGEDRSRTVVDPIKGVQPWWLSRPSQAASGNVVKNNLVQYCGQVLHGTVGVWIGMANTTTVSHNLIRYLPQIGISVGWVFDGTPTPAVRGNAIESNHIHDAMLMLSDGGGIYILGIQPETVLHGNLIHDIPIHAGLLDSNAVFCDQDSAHLSIDGNAMFNVADPPLRFHIGGYNIVSQNTLVTVDPKVPPIRYVATDSTDIMLVDNTLRIEDAGVGCGDPTYDVGPLAGLEPGYHTRLLGGRYGFVAPNECRCLTCQGDVNNSEFVDSEDIQDFVSTMLGGSYSSCADVDHDGLVGGSDIPSFVNIVMAGTPCSDLPVGACCEENGSCSEASDIACAAVGGSFSGDGITCVTGLCPQPTGICCLCEQCERLGAQDCINQGGLFFRVIAECEDVEPCPTLPIGACCHPDDTCDVRTMCSCEGLGGFYFGHQTDCGAGSPNIYNSAPGIPIDGSQTITHTINVPDSFVIGDVNIQLDLPHTWVGDLRIVLDHLGRTASLMDTILFSGCGDDLSSIMLDDEGAGGNVQEQCSFDKDAEFPTSPPSYVPYQPLMEFDGLDAAGDWTITVTDVFPLSDDGQLNAWTLFIDVVDEQVCDDIP